MKDYSQFILQNMIYKRHFPKFSLIYYSLSFVYVNTLSCQLGTVYLSPLSLLLYVIFTKGYSFFFFFFSNVLYTWKFIVQQFSYKDIAEESISYKYTIIHSDTVQVLMLWQRKVGAFMNLNIFHISYVNIMINNQLHSQFRTCNVAFS